MTTLRRALLLASVLGLPGPHLASAAEADGALGASRATLERLAASPAAADRRALGDLLAVGLPVSAANPLRAPDRPGAVRAYREAIAAGDRSPETLAALARLALFDENRALLAEIGPMLRQAAFRQDGEAAFLLAVAVRDGWLQAEETPEALMKAAAVMGSLSALLDIARSGEAPSQTVKLVALAELRDKAMNGSAGAMVSLAHAYRDGLLTGVDEAMATKWLEAAAALNHVPAMVELAGRLVHGVGGPADPARALDLLRRAARGGSSDAAMAIGDDAADLGLLSVSQEEGRQWLAWAAETGTPRAAAQLASLDLRAALRGDVSPELRTARIDAALAPIAGDPDALASLAARFRTSADGALLEVRLLPLLHRRALEGSIAAGLALDAWLRLGGRPMPDDAGAALVAALRADADTGVAQSSYTLAALSLDGRIGPAALSREEAVDRLFDAASLDVGQAALRIGKMYAYGQTFAKSRAFAKRWFEKAAALDVEAARWLLADLEMRDGDAAERAAGERFYAARMAAGDARAASADVAWRLRAGILDAAAIARAEEIATTAASAVSLARILVAGGRPDLAEAARRVLQPFVGSNPDPQALVVFARTLMDTGAAAPEHERAVSMLERAVALGSDEASIALAGIYLSNISYASKQAEAVELLETVLARDPTDIAARLLLSDAYLLGYGVARDPKKANDLIGGVLVQSSSDSPEAAILEADWLSFSDAKRDPRRAVDLLRQQVERGSVAAGRALAVTYLNGFGPAHDADLAAGLMFGAASGGDKEAMAGLGHLLLNGMGVARAPRDGIAWLQKAADAGNATAMYDLSRIFALGTGGETDQAKSIAWLTRAAERGHPAATYQLAVAYLEGDGVARDRDEALRWLKRSEAGGNLLAGRTIRQIETAGPDADRESIELE